MILHRYFNRLVYVLCHSVRLYSVIAQYLRAYNDLLPYRWHVPRIAFEVRFLHARICIRQRPEIVLNTCNLFPPSIVHQENERGLNNLQVAKRPWQFQERGRGIDTFKNAYIAHETHALYLLLELIALEWVSVNNDDQLSALRSNWPTILKN